MCFSVNEWKKRKRKTEEQTTGGNQEIFSSTGKPVFHFGLYFAMYKASRVLRLLFIVLSIMSKELCVNMWPISKWCCLIAENDDVDIGWLVCGEIPWFSKILHWNCRMSPIYWSLQTRHSYLQIISEQRGFESLSLCLIIEPMEKVFINSILRFRCGSHFWVKISYFIFSFIWNVTKIRKKYVYSLFGNCSGGCMFLIRITWYWCLQYVKENCCCEKKLTKLIIVVKVYVGGR